MEINIDIYPERDILNSEEFEKQDQLNGISLPLYIQKAAYPYLPEKLVIEYSGFPFKGLCLMDYAPVRFQERC